MAASVVIPFIAAGAVIAGLVIILENLWMAFEGGDSIIGNFVNQFTEKFPKITEVLKGIASFIRMSSLLPLMMSLTLFQKFLDLLVDWVA